MVTILLNTTSCDIKQFPFIKKKKVSHIPKYIEFITQPLLLN